MKEKRKSGFQRAVQLAIMAGLLVSSHTRVLAESSEAEPEKVWKQTLRSGSSALDANEYWIAEPLLKQAATQAEQFGTADMRLATSLGELGRLYQVRGFFDKAEPYYESELVVAECALGKDTGKTIPVMGGLIQFYLMHGTAEKADAMTEQLLAFLEGRLNEVNSQASVKFQEGQPLTGWAGKAAPSATDPLVEWSITCDAVANCYKARKNFDMAERLYKVSLDLKETVLGKGHLSLANSYDNLGTIYMERNDYSEAESFFSFALDTTERTLSPDNPQVYARLDKLARCLIKEGKLQKAEDLYIRAQGFFKDLSKKHVNEARALYSLGSLYADQKRYAEAAAVFKQALIVAEEVSGPESISLVPYLERYAYTLYYLGQRDETDRLRARASNITGLTQ